MRCSCNSSTARWRCVCTSVAARRTTSSAYSRRVTLRRGRGIVARDVRLVFVRRRGLVTALRLRGVDVGAGARFREIARTQKLGIERLAPSFAHQHERRITRHLNDVTHLVSRQIDTVDEVGQFARQAYGNVSHQYTDSWLCLAKHRKQAVWGDQPGGKQY